MKILWMYFMKQSIKILLSGGGTGGHIYPAVAIANALKKRHPEAEFLFVGAKDRMEMEKIPQSGYAIKGLWISGLQRKLTFANLLFPIKLLSSLLKARHIIKTFQPDVAIGTGGYASGATLYMASNKGIPTLIQEQNSFPGITNKILGKKVDKICVAYDNLEAFFPKEKIIKTGNPVRRDLLEVAGKKAEAVRFFNLNPQQKTLLVLGGSLGAKKINQMLEKNLEFIKNQGIQVIWQSGKLYIEMYKKYRDSTVQVHDFLNNMDYAYAAADFIISRAGAGTISELCLVGKPVIFVPSPNVAEDHQTKNAMAIVAHHAAIMLKESELNRFQPVFSGLLQDEITQQKLSENIKSLALPQATEKIVDEVEKLIMSKK